MKNSYEYTMSQSEFWNYIINKVKILLDDMDNFDYTDANFEKKIKEVDQRFLSFIWAMKFVAYEEEIIDPSKKNDVIEDVLDIDTINKFVHNETDISKNLLPVNTLFIKGPDYVLHDEEHDSRWVLEVIKKCIAHGNFSLDFNKGVYIIDNSDPANELYCEVGCYWLAQLGNIITPERNMTVNKTDLLLKPYVFSYLDKQLKTEEDLRTYISSPDFVCYFPLIILDGTYEEKLAAKRELLSFWNNIIIDCGFDGPNVLINKMPDMTKKVNHGQISLASLGSKHFDRIYSEVNNVRDFYKMSPQSQQCIIENIMYDIVCIELFPSQTHNIDFGLDLLGNQAGLSKFLGYLENCASKGQYMHPSAPRLFADYSYNYGTYKKKIALAYFIGMLLFSGNKDEIFDDEIDYDSFDLSNIVAYDFAGGKEIQRIITNLKNGISLLEENGITKKTEKTLYKKIEKLKKFEEQLLDATADVPAKRPSNKEIFHRIRNAISHKQIYNIYIQNEESGISSSIDQSYIMLKDEDKFIAYINVDDLLSLLMDDKFLNALTKYESKKSRNI